jgi:hypothetical protein
MSESFGAPARDPVARLVYALEQADEDDLRAIAAEGVDIGAPIPSAQYQGLTPLMLAAQWGNAALCGVLIELGADPHATAHGPLEITALGNAAYMGRMKACRLLLEKTPPKAHILKAIELARSGWGHSPHIDAEYRAVLNALLWARDGITLPGSVTNLLAGEHPEVGEGAPPVRRPQRPR